MLLTVPGRPAEPIGAYRVIGRLTKGGMGDILLAERRHFDGTTEQVVLKMLSAELQEEPYVSMFMSEAAVMSQLDHPNVVRLIDMPVVNGSRCIALELVRGTNLFQLMRRARAANETVPVEIAVYIGLEVLAGLSYAHAATVDGVPINLVHRDVKPGNVLLSRDGDVKLTDFGISKSDLSTLKTLSGVVKGTPHYLSPEQVRGDRATPRSDLFSLAAVLVEAISGTPLFKRDSLASTLLSVSTGDREKIEELLPKRHRALARVLERALAVDPLRRFENASAMASAIAGACPIDDGEARRELSRRVTAICEKTKEPLQSGQATRRLSSTGAIPLEPADFDEDVPTDESPEIVEPPRRSDRVTESMRAPSLVSYAPTVAPVKTRNWSFFLGFLFGALTVCGVQVALRLLSISAW